VAYKEIMDELHLAREKIYEETKDMTPDEFAAWLGRRTADTVERLELPRRTRPATTRGRRKE